jgi:hypothetical protein
MSYIPLAKIKTISEQGLAVRIKHPDFTLNSTLTSMSIKGWSRPTARSVVYSYELKYTLHERPAIKILEPILEKYEGSDDLPHVHEGDELCLYFPFYNEFTHRELLTDTVVPWIALWIFYYEKWAVSGKWLGGGIH